MIASATCSRPQHRRSDSVPPSTFPTYVQSVKAMTQRPHFPRFGCLLAALAIALPACLAAPSTAIADSRAPEEMGLQIALQAQERGEGFGDFTQTSLRRAR